MEGEIIKMKILKLMLEYGCFPIWTYEKKDVLTENDFPKENPPSQRLDELKTIIAKEYMSTFINDTHEFSYKGFHSKEECQKFVDKLNEFRDLVQEEYSKKYKIIDDFDDYSEELK